MKGSHLHIESDTKILKEIRKAIKKKLTLNPSLLKKYLLIKLIVFVGLTLVLYFFLFQSENIFLFCSTYIMLGFSTILLAFNFAHDFSHNTVFRNRNWNNLGYIATFSLVGAHAEPWRERHIKDHHFAPNVKEYDTDLQITNLIRIDEKMDYHWFHRFQYLYAPIAYCTYTLYWIFIKDLKVMGQTTQQQGFNFKYLLSFILQKAFYFSYLLILPLLLTEQSSETVIMGFLLMHFFQSIFLLFTFFISHHVIETSYPIVNKKGEIQTSWFMNQVKSSNDINPFCKFANFIFGGFNNHIAHHLLPHIHHFYYPELNKILYGILNNNGISPNNTTYFGGILSHLKLLRKLSSE